MQAVLQVLWVAFFDSSFVQVISDGQLDELKKQ